MKLIPRKNFKKHLEKMCHNFFREIDFTEIKQEKNQRFDPIYFCIENLKVIIRSIESFTSVTVDLREDKKPIFCF